MLPAGIMNAVSFCQHVNAKALLYPLCENGGKVNPELISRFVAGVGLGGERVAGVREVGRGGPSGFETLE